MKALKSNSARLVLILVFLAGALGGTFISFGVTTASSNSEGYMQKIQVFNNVLGYIRDFYVEEESIEAEKLMYGAIDGLLKTLDDPYTELMRPDRFDDMRTETAQEFGGLGIFITIRRDKLTVIAPIEGTPAFEAGMQPGDTLEAIDGESTKEITTTSEAVKILRGPKGTEVELTIGRAGETFDVTIVRDDIPIQSVFSRAFEDNDYNIGYVKVTNFGERTYQEIQDALQEIHSDDFDGLLLDLRSNPGGLLTAAYQVANIWIDEGKIVYTKGRARGQDKDFPASAQGTERDYPMMVLVNSGSASGSEIVAGALKDHNRAIVVGDTTFGKGLVQSVFPLDDGAALKVTTARYYTPGGHMIQDQGIPPHVPVKQETPDTTALREIGKLIEGDTVLDFIREYPEPEEEEIQNFIQKLREQGFELEDRFIRFQIMRQISAREGRTTVSDPATDQQLNRALEYFAQTLRQTPWKVEDAVSLLNEKQ